MGRTIVKNFVCIPDFQCDVPFSDADMNRIRDNTESAFNRGETVLTRSGAFQGGIKYPLVGYRPWNQDFIELYQFYKAYQSFAVPVQNNGYDSYFFTMDYISPADSNTQTSLALNFRYEVYLHFGQGGQLLFNSEVDGPLAGGGLGVKNQIVRASKTGTILNPPAAGQTIVGTVEIVMRTALDPDQETENKLVTPARLRYQIDPVTLIRNSPVDEFHGVWAINMVFFGNC